MAYHLPTLKEVNFERVYQVISMASRKNSRLQTVLNAVSRHLRTKFIDVSEVLTYNRIVSPIDIMDAKPLFEDHTKLIIRIFRILHSSDLIKMSISNGIATVRVAKTFN